MTPRFIEVKSSNMDIYLGKILKLQDEIYEKLKEQKCDYLFFKSSEEEIREYIESSRSLVSVLEADDILLSVCYFTFDHTPYNDLTLYIKNSPIYKQFVLEDFSQTTLATVYINHLKSYRQLKEDGIITDELLNELRLKVKNDDFYENDPLREKLSHHLKRVNILSDPIHPWVLSTDLPQLNSSFLDFAKEYDEFISSFKYHYLTLPEELAPKLISLSDYTVGELDTYFSAPQYQNKGYASELIRLTIENAMEHHHLSAISATVHPLNYVSYHILQNLGFKTFCTVERRKGVARNVMFKIL